MHAELISKPLHSLYSLFFLAVYKSAQKLFKNGFYVLQMIFTCRRIDMLSRLEPFDVSEAWASHAAACVDLQGRSTNHPVVLINRMISMMR
jgi:hypothetical protein